MAEQRGGGGRGGRNGAEGGQRGAEGGGRGEVTAHGGMFIGAAILLTSPIGAPIYIYIWPQAEMPPVLPLPRTDNLSFLTTYGTTELKIVPYFT